ncbi:DUF3073 domain-containing protein [Acidothermaceae bacterium B102]|jgi:hypothetical protein|nr:DUF3073 domain-containing protein [Acidothermaceae bacterium B102]
MGRGRAKAKQTKVARELKYSSGGTDLDRLRAELAGEPVVRPVPSEPPSDEDDEYTDPYADAFDDEDEPESPTGQDHRTA